MHAIFCGRESLEFVEFWYLDAYTMPRDVLRIVAIDKMETFGNVKEVLTRNQAAPSSMPNFVCLLAGLQPVFQGDVGTLLTCYCVSIHPLSSIPNGKCGLTSGDGITFQISNYPSFSPVFSIVEIAT